MNDATRVVRLSELISEIIVLAELCDQPYMLSRIAHFLSLRAAERQRFGAFPDRVV